MVHTLYFNGYCRMRVIQKFLFHVESVSHHITQGCGQHFRSGGAEEYMYENAS